jgi:hypothetical protein
VNYAEEQEEARTWRALPGFGLALRWCGGPACRVPAGLCHRVCDLPPVAVLYMFAMRSFFFAQAAAVRGTFR